MTPLSIRWLRFQLWCESLFESMPFYVTVKHVQPIAKPPYEWPPYWAFVNRIGLGPWWRFWHRWAESRTLGPTQQFEDIGHVMRVARQQAYEVLHPEAVEAVKPPEPYLKAQANAHGFEWRMTKDGFIAACSCGWKGEHVGDASGDDPVCRFEFDVHANEAEAQAKVGQGMPKEA